MSRHLSASKYVFWAVILVCSLNLAMLGRILASEDCDALESYFIGMDSVIDDYQQWAGELDELSTEDYQRMSSQEFRDLSTQANGLALQADSIEPSEIAREFHRLAVDRMYLLANMFNDMATMGPVFSIFMYSSTIEGVDQEIEQEIDNLLISCPELDLEFGFSQQASTPIPVDPGQGLLEEAELADVYAALDSQGLNVEYSADGARVDDWSAVGQGLIVEGHEVYVFIFPDAASREANVSGLTGDEIQLTDAFGDPKTEEALVIAEASNVVVVVLGGDENLLEAVEAALQLLTR
jgi:hypothetical protein